MKIIYILQYLYYNSLILHKYKHFQRHLHSTIFILQPPCTGKSIFSLNTFTFYNIYITTIRRTNGNGFWNIYILQYLYYNTAQLKFFLFFSIFTFYNIYITTQRNKYRWIEINIYILQYLYYNMEWYSKTSNVYSNLHSTIFILQHATIYIDLIANKFTFYNIYITTKNN